MAAALLIAARRISAAWQRINARLRSTALFYSLWRRTYERPFRAQTAPPNAPGISLITWIGDESRARTLRRMAAMLDKQNYLHWRWIIVALTANFSPEGEGSQPSPPAPLPPGEGNQCLFVSPGLSEAAALNRAVAASPDHFVLILPVGDTLASFTLTVLANALAQHPDADVLLFDEDSRGRWPHPLRHSPRFKVANAPEALSVADTWQRAVLIRRSAWQASGGLDETLSAAAARWDLYKRLSDRNCVVRVPVIGYTQCSPQPESHSSQTRADSSHVGRETPRMKVSIIIPTRDHVTLLRACLDTILSTCSYPDFEVILVDTGSVEPATNAYYETLAADPRVRFVRDVRQPFNYAMVNNSAAQIATGDALLFLNNDTQPLHADWLERMTHWLRIPDVAIVGARLMFPDTRRIQHAGVILGAGQSGLGGHLFAYQPENVQSSFGNADQVRNVMAVTGACMLVRRTTFEALGGFDTAYRLVYSDIDLCIRTVERGQRVVVTPDARLLHHESVTHRGNLPRADFERAARRWQHWLREGDPYYHPALSYTSSVPMLRLPNEPTPYERITHLLSLMPDTEILTPAQLLVLGIRLQGWSLFR